MDSEHVCVCVCSAMSNSATPWAVDCQALLSVGFPRQEYWNVLPFPSPGTLPDPGIEPVTFVSPALAGGFLITESPGEPSGLKSTQSYRELHGGRGGPCPVLCSWQTDTPPAQLGRYQSI